MAPPESLLQRLSQHYVSGADLQVALASLELSILQNISRQLEGNTREGTGAAVSREVRRLRRRLPWQPSTSRCFYFLFPSVSGRPRDRGPGSASFF